MMLDLNERLDGRGRRLPTLDGRDFAIDLDQSLCLGKHPDHLSIIFETPDRMSKQPLQPAWVLQFGGREFLDTSLKVFAISVHAVRLRSCDFPSDDGNFGGAQSKSPPLI